MMRYLVATGLMLGLGLAGPAAAQSCEVTVKSNDKMEFDVNAIEVDKSCEEFTVKLVHVGELPRNVMGHNWVLTRKDDMQLVATDGVAAGLANDYVKPGDQRALAHTDVIGGGQSTSVTFSTDKQKKGSEYVFFCSFPGHAQLMNGTLTLK